MISGWAEPVEIGAPARAVVVANRSDEPVYRVNVFLEDEDDQDENHEIVVTEIRSDSINTRYISVLPPKQQVLLKVNRKNPNSSGPRTHGRCREFTCCLMIGTASAGLVISEATFIPGPRTILRSTARCGLAVTSVPVPGRLHHHLAHRKPLRDV